MTFFSVQTFGCRVNQAESFAWVNEFQKRGLRYRKEHSRSDVILVNTCTVTKRADGDVRKFIRKIQRTNPKARLVLTGCFAERAQEELARIPQVWRIVPNQEKEGLFKGLFPDAAPEDINPETSYRSRALVKIQDGCDYGCRFCIVPSVRGKSVSFPKERILSQAREYVAGNFKEIVLTGVHLCLYGRDLTPRSSLLELLEGLERVPGLKQIRLSSLDPRIADDDLLSHITSSSRVCPHFHLSLQSGCDRVLRSMGREAQAASYRKILDTLRERSPTAALGADIMAGFPGESDEDFECTCDFLAASPLTYFHVFVYSPRPGTPAAEWPPVEDKVKFERASLLRGLSGKKNRSFRELFLGKECRAIVVKKECLREHVLTSNYIDVEVPFSSHEEKNAVTVRITAVKGHETFGEITKDGVTQCSLSS